MKGGFRFTTNDFSLIFTIAPVNDIKTILSPAQFTLCQVVCLAFAGLRWECLRFHDVVPFIGDLATVKAF